MAKLYNWGDNGAYSRNGTGTTFTQVEKGKFAEILLDSNNDVWTWGQYFQNGLGYTGTTGNRSTPVLLTGGTWQLGDTCTFTLKNYIFNSAGTLYGFGQGQKGDMGDGTTTCVYYSPTKIGTKTWKYVAGDYYSSAGVTTDGKLWTWGHNLYYLTGLNINTDTYTTTPTQPLTGITNWNKVVVTYGPSGAITDDGKLYTWGADRAGQTAQGKYGGIPPASTTYTPIPTLVTGHTGWTDVSFGSGWNSSFHGAGIKSNGTVWTWGQNTHGECGLGYTSSGFTTPQQVTGITNAVQVKCGFGWVVIRTSDNKLYTWGWDIAAFPLNIGNVTTPTQFVTNGKWTDISINWYLSAVGNLLAAPTGLTISETCDSLDLFWVNNNTTDITGNTIQRYTGTTWFDLVYVSSGTTGYTFTGLTEDTSYIYRVVAEGDGLYTNSSSITGTTLSIFAPSGLTTSNVTCTGFTLTWVNNDECATENTIQYSAGTWTDYATVSSDTTSINITGLTPNYDTYWRVVANSTPSNEIDVWYFNPTGATTNWTLKFSNGDITTIPANNPYRIEKRADGKYVIVMDVTGAGGRIYVYNSDFTLYATSNTVSDAILGGTAAIWFFNIQTDNKILVGGNFTKYGGTTTGAFIRLNEDLTLDTAFQNNLNGGAGFSHITVAAAYMPDIGYGATVWIQAQGGMATPWEIGATVVNDDGTYKKHFADALFKMNNDYKSMWCQSDGDMLYIKTGGYLTRVKNTSALLVDTGYTQTQLISDGSGYKLSFDSNDNAYVYNKLLGVNSTTVGGLAKILKNGTVDSSFNIGTGFLYNNIDDLWDLKVAPNGKVYVVFTPYTTTQLDRYNSFSGTSVWLMCRLNTDGSLDTHFHHPIRNINGYGKNDNPAAGGGFYWVQLGELIINSDTEFVFTGDYLFNGSPVDYYAIFKFNLENLDKYSPDCQYDPAPYNLIASHVSSGLTYNLIWNKGINYEDDDFGCYVIKYKKVDDSSYTISSLPYNNASGATIVFPRPYKYNLRLAAVASEYPADILIGHVPPTGLTVTYFDYFNIDIAWVNAESTGYTAITVQLYSGSTWIDYAILPTGSTTYSFTGLTADVSYTIRVGYWIDGIFYYSDDVTQITAELKVPTGLTISNIHYSGVTLSWVNNETTYIDSNEIEKYIGGTWVDYLNVSSGTTSSPIAIAPNTTIPLRVCLRYYGTDYCSSAVTATTLSLLAPTGLTVTTTGGTSIDISWTNVSDGNLVLYQKSPTSGWIPIWSGDTGTTSFTSTGLTPSTYYQYYISITNEGYTFNSPVVGVATLSGGLPVPSFCTTAPFIVSGSTCGNADGLITIINLDYFLYYDFVLTDIWGNSYTFNPATGLATGLTGSYYFLTADIKPVYWGVYGRDACSFDWIKIQDTNNPAYLVRVSVRDLQCQPFDVQYGRIWYEISGLTSGSTYAFYAFTSDFTLYYSKTGITTTNDFILANAAAQCYWVLIKDEVTGCILLLDNRCIDSMPLFNQGGIKKLYIAKWNDTDLDYNYWKTSDEDYFLEFEDTSFFFSTKIKEYLSLTSGTTGITWYSIPVLPKVVKLSQKLNKVRQGFIFEDTLTVAVAKATAVKWLEMRTILNPEDKWIFIVQDADDFWWTGGYRHGARISVYQFRSGARGEDNGYAFEFAAVSENKLLTNIDENYVNTYVK